MVSFDLNAMDQLFLLEILVDTIFFNKPETIVTKKQINIVARFGNFASLEIRNDGLGGVEESEYIINAPPFFTLAPNSFPYRRF